MNPGDIRGQCTCLHIIENEMSILSPDIPKTNRTRTPVTMKTRLRKIFSPILELFEKDGGEYNYKHSHRTVLIVVSFIFLFLSLVSLAAAIYTAQPGAPVPFVVFFSAGAVCAIVGFLGSDRAVAKIWGNR